MRLMRFDRPIGTLLLLWPTYWALWLASQGHISLSLFVIFTLGTIIMRAAGCIINDYADRNVDGHVKRTKNRPLPSGDVTTKEAKLLFLFLVILAFILVLQLNLFSISLSIVAIALTIIYPFMKRYTHFPQVVLGAAFSWGMMMAYGAVVNHLPLEAWLLFAANMAWTVAYDTQYAMVDRDDDLKIGVKSTAIFFGQYDVLAISLLQILTILLLAIVGFLTKIHYVYFLSLIPTSVLFAYQYRLIRLRERDDCFKAFLSNNWAGLFIFIGFIFSFYLPYH